MSSATVRRDRGPSAETGGEAGGGGTVLPLFTLLLVLASTADAANPCPGTGFVAARDFATGVAPQYVVAADFNKDGNADLAVAGKTWDTVSVHLGDGSGGFAAAVDYSTASHPVYLAAADLDSDGNPDLVSADSDHGSVSVLLGSASGTFGATNTYAAAANPVAVAPADFDEDGKLDLAVVSAGTNAVVLLRGDGSGVFTSLGSTALPTCGSRTAVRAVASGDLNQDGHADLAVGMAGRCYDDAFHGNGIAILQGSGSGTFTVSWYEPGVLEGPSSVALVDVDRDTRPDIVATFATGEIFVWPGNGRGGVAPAIRTVRPAGGSPSPGSGARVVDADGDGILDVVTSGDTAGYASQLDVWLGDGTGRFPRHHSYGLTLAPWGKSLALADFNNDGVLDAAVAREAADSVSVALGAGSGRFCAPETFRAGSSWGPFALAQLDQGTPLDLSSGGHAFFGDGATSFGWPVDTHTGWSGGAGGLPGRFDADSFVDLAGAWNSGLHVAFGDGNGGFSATTDYALAASMKSFAVGDFDGDGFTDAAVGLSNGTLAVFRSNGVGGFKVPLTSALEAPTFLVTGDFNGDGKLDLASSDEIAASVFVLLGNGDGTFAAPVAHAVGSAAKSLTAGDFDQDGKLDLLVPDHWSGTLSILRGDGSGGFTAVATNVTGVRPWGVALVQVDGDGLPDLAVTDASDHDVTIWLRQGTGNYLFTRAGGATLPPDPNAALALDIDADGCQELFVRSGTATSLLRNNRCTWLPVLNVNKVGAGSGRITGTGIDCGADCAEEYAAGTLVSLTATASAGSAFLGWSGACTGTGSCSVTMSAARQVAASFGLSVSINDASASEGGGHVDFTVTLSAAAGVPVVVEYATNGGTATAGTDYAAAAGAVTFNAGELTKSISLTILEDGVEEADETVLLELSQPRNATIADGQGVATIVDNDLAGHISVTNTSIAEGDSGTASMLFALVLSGVPAAPVTVNYVTGGGTAVAGTDYTAVAGTLTFAAGETAKAISVPIIGDTLDEDNETLDLTLSNPTNAGLGCCTTAVATGTIVDDDAPPTLAVSDVTATEGDNGTTDAIFTVTLVGQTTFTAAVSYATASGTAAAGSDYTTVAGSLTFAPGETTKTVTVPVTGDMLDEADETFVVNLSAPSRATIADGQGTATITDDDPSPTLSIGDATVAEGSSGTTAAVFTVTLSAVSGQSVTVGYTTVEGTAQAPSDYTRVDGVLAFAPGETSKTVSVAVNGDELYEADETFSVVLSVATNATIADGTGLGTITNDDLATVAIGTRTKTVTSERFVPRGALSYTITVTNTGSATQADNAGHELVDVLPSELESITASASMGTAAVSGNTVVWDGSLASGASVTVTIEAKVKATVAVGTTVTNQATVSYDANVDGVNESTALTDDPAHGGDTDATSFTVQAPMLKLYTLVPCRLIDTRQATGTYGGPALAAGASRVFPLAGRCNVPATARAVSVNVTVTSPAAGGYLQLYPAGPEAPLVSAINYTAGQTRANNAIVPLNASAEIGVSCGQPWGTVELVMDVNGYFE